MPKKGYVSVSIPEELGKDIDKIKRSGHGYRSRAEVVVDAVRRLVTDLKKPKPLEVPA
jgi:metal-responsive CopG/Arc/MetJ family transcriptional regulator